MKQEIEIEGLPEGWVVRRLRIVSPNVVEIYPNNPYYNSVLEHCKFECEVTVQKSKPRQMSHIEILVDEAIQKISNMTPDEIKEMFIKHGYDPDESKQPRRIMLEETEELRKANSGEFYESTVDGIVKNTTRTKTEGEYKIWKVVE